MSCCRRQTHAYHVVYLRRRDEKCFCFIAPKWCARVQHMIYGAGHPKRTPVGDSKCNALYNQGQGRLPRNINFKVLSSSYDDG